MNAPFCPVSRSQPVFVRGPAPVKLPVIPLATDLPSLIRAVNIQRDILRTLTTSLTVNNVYIPRRVPQIDYKMSPYPEWYQVWVDNKEGFVYYKSKSGKDQEQRAYVRRIFAVEYHNQGIDNDNPFFWRYTKDLDSEFGDKGQAPPFLEDFFERVVNVHWSAGLAVEFYDGAT